MNNEINLYALKSAEGTAYVMPYALNKIDQLWTFMRLVVYGEMTFYSDNLRKGKAFSSVSPLGLHMTRLCEYSELYSKDYQFSPLLDFFFEQYRSHPIKDYCMMLEGSDLDSVALFNGFIAAMRLEASKVKLKKKVADWESKAKKNKKRLEEFERRLFQRYARLMVIRLDFNYHKAEFTDAEIEAALEEKAALKKRDLEEYLAGDDLTGKRVWEGRISLEEVQKDRKRLFTNLKGKRSLFEHLVGYVWRIECGREAGYHLHVMFFFDGSQVHKHEYLAQEIGKYWRDVITDGRGYFHNCNLDRRRYGNASALGEVNYWDIKKRENLRQAMTYFCKSNQVVQMLPYPGCRLFGTGFSHREREGRAGRPRLYAPTSLGIYVSSL